MPRQTSDLVALILAVTVAVVVIVTALGTIYIAIVQPDDPNGGFAADTISRLVSVMVGALVGYMAGRGATTDKPEQ